MKLIFYKTETPNNYLTKELVEKASLNIFLKRDTNVIFPTILINVDSLNKEALKESNYCRIEELNRYYYVRNITSINNSLLQFECECDVLMTYKEEILKSWGKVRRGYKSGDYFNTSLATTTMKTITREYGNVAMPEGETIILSTIGA